MKSTYGRGPTPPRRIRTIALVLALVLALALWFAVPRGAWLPGGAWAGPHTEADSTPAPEPTRADAPCMGCHGRAGITLTFGDGASAQAYVDYGGMKASAHAGFSCVECHDRIEAAPHKARHYRDAAQFRLKSARICRRCHQDAQISVNPVHAELLKAEQGGNAPLCQECHGAHAVQPVFDRTTAEPERTYCMGCHAHRLAVTLASGESLGLSVDAGALQSSVHANLSCSDCHFGFSSEEHPMRAFRDARQYTLAASEVCKRCHFDKYVKVSESIHFDLLSQGDRRAPGCTDCHGSHGIESIRANRLACVQKCRGCHTEVYDTYVQSVHGAALLEEHNRDVPVCTDCHVSHRIQDSHAAGFHVLIPHMCSNCHANKRVMDRYGLSTDVVRSYLSDFHGQTLELYRLESDAGGADASTASRNIAVCTDCHGVHAIASVSGPDSPAIKANLVKRCRACHTDATEDFPDAWLSHYSPSLAHAPLVYVVDVAYRVMMPLMLLGLLVQILLHIWRFLVNR
jgi:hypothetical protein